MGRSGYETSEFAVAICSLYIKSITRVQVLFELKEINAVQMVSSFQGKNLQL